MHSIKVLEEAFRNGNTRMITSMTREDPLQRTLLSIAETAKVFSPCFSVEQPNTDHSCNTLGEIRKNTASEKSMNSYKTDNHVLGSTSLYGPSEDVLLSTQIQIWNNVRSPEFLETILRDEDQHIVKEDTCWRADSVRRKRKKKMNKHKHAKRRKLNRHRK